jgi:two-component system CheB/CheR fusion protein
MTATDHRAPHRDPVIVGLGASAGGITALKRLFATIPEKTGIAWVVVVHLSPEHESHLPEILQPHAKLRIVQVTETVPLEADHIYVIPPGRNLTTIDTHVTLHPLEANRRERAPIDHFFRTLSEAHGPRAIAVVLSGTGSDGSLGLRRIKEQGGLTIAQDPGEADFDGMPYSAIATGFVDLVLPLEDMATAILRYARTEPRVPLPIDGEELEAGAKHELQTLLTLVRARTGRDFTRYKVSTILRRIRRRMQLRQVTDLESYISQLRHEPAEAAALSDEFLIVVTNFFRDPEVYDHLATDVVPQLFEGRGPEDRIRVWSVGCATGEESYSLAMLLLEEAGRREHPPAIQIFASDVHEPSLLAAREGSYPQAIEVDVAPERLRTFFTREDGTYRIRRHVREMVVFTPHDLLADPPFSQLDLIACRNVLIYLQRDVQNDVMRLFHYALRPGGYLLLGTSETVESTQLFDAADKDHRIFVRRGGPPVGPHLPVFPLSVFKRSPGVVPRPRPLEEGGAALLHLRLIERHAPPSILVDREQNVVHVSQTAGRYLQVPAGEATSNLVKLVKDELRLELRAALHAARDAGEPSRTRAVRVAIDGTPREVVVRLHPAEDPDHAGHVLVVFHESDVTTAPELGDSETVAVRALEGELDATKRHMQAVIDQYDGTQEEMRAANEELQSANEELRSTMEELETSKEELQSLNEELTTLNQENRHKVEELSQLTGDLQNLLTSTDIATIFLDRNLRILRYTPRVGELFNVRESDRGRPLTDLTHRLGTGHLREDAEQVLAKLVPIEREVQREDGRWFLARVLPYRTVDDRIEGIVLTFVDVTPLKHAQEELRQTEESLALALDAAGMATFDLDLGSGNMIRRHALLDRLFGYTAPQPEWSLDQVRRHIVEEDRTRFDAAFAASTSTARFDVEVRVEWPNGAVRWLHILGRPYLQAGVAARMLGVALDVTLHKHAEDELVRWGQTLEARVAERTREVRGLAARLAQAEHEERRRLSRVLHDELQQLLFAASMRLTMAAEEGGATAPADLAETSKLIDRAVNLTRRLTVDLAPPVLRGEGLSEALEWLVRQSRELHGLEVELEIEQPVRIRSEGLRVMLFQIVRELLFNVVKHAGVSRATITVGERDDEAVVTVADEGIGLQAGAPEGTGLRSSREQVELLGGHFSVVSADGKGTRVTISVPKDPASEGEARSPSESPPL